MKSVCSGHLDTVRPDSEACNSGWFELDVPFVVRGKTTIAFRLHEKSLIGSKNHFLRFDLYPLVSPSFMARHYGWWDVPMSKVRSEMLRISFEPQRGQFSFAGRWWEENAAKFGPREFCEPGYCMLHVSIWEKAGSEARMRALRSYSIVLLGDSADLPLKGFNIPVTDRCNLACTMCPRQGTERLVEQDIPEAVLNPLLEAAGHVFSVTLQGLGEPLLYERLPEIMHAVKVRMPPHGRVGFTTNATLLSKRLAEKLLNAGTDFIYFSVDGAVKATYESIRIGAHFDRVMENIGRCVDLRRSLPYARPEFMFNCVVTDRNYREVPLLVELAAKLGIENVTFSRYQSTGDDLGEAFDITSARRFFDDAVRIGAQHGMNVFVPSVETSTPEKCLFMERVVVMNSGDVLPCHMMAPGYAFDDRAVVFGNVREASLPEIWQKPGVREFRRRVLEGDFPSECQGCECKAFLVP